MKKRSWFIGVGVFLYLCSLIALGGFSVPADQDVLRIWNESFEYAENPSEFNLLVWNIKKLEKRGAKEDLVNFSKKYDLMLIQEFASDEKLNSYWESYKNHRIDFAISFLRRKEFQTGVAHISNFSMDELVWVRSVGLEPLVDTPKMTTLSTHTINNKQLMIVNIHSINFVDDDVYENEMNRIESILSRHQGPLIFAGDFNCWNKDRKKIVNRVAKNLNLQFTQFPEREKSIWGIIDHVLYRGVHIVDPHVLEHYNSSDHKPLIMKVVVD